MKLRNITSTILILSTLTSALPLAGFADGEQNSQTSGTGDVFLEMSVMKEKAAAIQDTKEKIAAVDTLKSQIQATQKDLATQETLLNNLPVTQDIVEKHNDLVSKRDADNTALNLYEKKLSGFPSEDYLKQKLQLDQNEYNTRKAWLTAPERKELEKHEIELRISLINEKQKALSDLQNALSDKCGNVGVDVGGTLFAGVAVGLIALVYANRAEISSWPFSIGVVLTTQVLGGGFLFGAGFVGGGVLCSMSTQKQLDAANANLQVSKDHLQVLVNAYNTK
jgi:hypothetical protein